MLWPVLIGITDVVIVKVVAVGVFVIVVLVVTVVVIVVVVDDVVVVVAVVAATFQTRKNFNLFATNRLSEAIPNISTASEAEADCWHKQNFDFMLFGICSFNKSWLNRQ